MVYRKTYFRIRTTGYDSADGWESGAARAAFSGEVCSIFSGLGWTVEKSTQSGVCDVARLGKQRLYLHPMHLEGVVLEDSIPVIEQAIAKARTFQYTHTDTCREYLDLSDADYLLLLRKQQEAMIADILSFYRTKRRNLFVTKGAFEKLMQKYHIDRLSNEFGVDTILRGVLENLIGMLSARGQLVQGSTKYGVGYRTATEKEKLLRQSA